MMDITTEEVNAHTLVDGIRNTPVFVITDSKVFLDLEALTGDTLGSDLSAINIAEIAIKFVDVLSKTAQEKFNNNNLEDARDSYPPVRSVLSTNSQGQQVIRFTGFVTTESTVGLDDVTAV